MTEVTLSAALRSTLSSLQGTQRLLDQTQMRLATGKKVNSALDDPSAFFAAQSLNGRASDLSRLLDGIGQGVQTLKAADEGIQALTSFLEQMRAVAQEARAALVSDPTADVDGFVESYNELRDQIDALVGDSGYRGTNLINGSDLTIVFNESGDSTIEIDGVDFTVDGLGVTVATFNDETEVDADLVLINEAIAEVKSQAQVFGTNLNIIQTREDFTERMISTLTEGADKLVLADINEEGAKLLSLQTTQQLGITALALASQAQQSILRLF